MKILIRVGITAVALWVATYFVSGITLDAHGAHTSLQKAGTLVGVAVIFGLLNAFLKPIIKVFGCAFYVLTLGLFALVVNALLLYLTSYIADMLKLPFHVNTLWAAFWGAIIVGVVSWLLNMFVSDDD
ncbi:MAG TPA: phage holin family protein [Streptosporangiaceae bacterium]|nr:phage holin family protein [Streptosporangiaceae bacterium]